MARLLRKRGHSRQASFLELFFDLTFIVSFAMLSARLLRDLNWLNVAQTVVLLAAFWWVWVATAWSTDWFNPSHPVIRGLVLGVMFLGLLMTAAIPEAYGEHGLLFAGAYVAVHLGRAAVLLPVLRGHPVQRRSLLVAIWFGLSAVPWLVGAFLPAPARLWVWLLAVLMDYAVPAQGWPVPRLGRLPEMQLRVVGEHLSERYRQIYIVALGEIFLVIGLTYSRYGIGPAGTVALALAFMNASLLLWMYFVPAGHRLGMAIEQNQPRGGVFAAYCHAIMIAGTVLTSVGIEIMVRHPLDHPRPSWSSALLGGTALFLLGRILLGKLVFAQLPWRSLLGLLVLLASGPGLVRLPLLAVGAVTNIVLLTVVLAYALAPEARRDRHQERQAEERQAAEEQVERERRRTD